MNFAAVMQGILLTLLVCIQVSGVPLPATIPTEVIPLGSSAPVTCPRPPVIDEPNGGTGNNDTVGDGTTDDAGADADDDSDSDTDTTTEERPPCTDLDLTLVLNSALEPLIKSSTEELILDVVSDLIGVIDDADLTLLSSATPNFADFATALSVPIKTALENFSPDLSLDQDDVRVDLRSAVVEFIQDGSYNCQINIADIDSAVNSYIDSGALQTLIDAEIADSISQINSVVGTSLSATTNSATLDQFSNDISQLIIDSLGTVDVVSPVLNQFFTVPLRELSSDTSVVTSIIVTNLFVANNGLTRSKRQALPDVEVTIAESISELIECTVCEVTKNSIDEVIVQAVSEILKSADAAGVINEDTISTTVTDTVTDAVVQKSFSDSVSSNIDDSLRMKVLEAIVVSLTTTDSNTIIDTNSVQNSIDSILEPNNLEGIIIPCVEDYLGDSSAIETAIINAVINAVVRKEVGEDVISSISVPAVCEEVVSAINSTLDTIDESPVVSAFESPLSDILSDIMNDPAIIDIVSDINGNYIESFLTPILEKFKFSPNKFKTALSTVGGFISGITDGIGNKKEISKFLSKIFSSLMKIDDDLDISDIVEYIQGLQDGINQPEIVPKTVQAPKTSDKSISTKSPNKLNKTLSKFKPLVATLLAGAKKLVKKFFPKSVPMLARAERRTKRALLSQKIDFLGKLHSDLILALSSVRDQLAEVGEWAAKFPPFVNGYNAIRDFDLADVRRDMVIFLSGFDFIDLDSLESFGSGFISLETLFNGIDLTDFDSRVIFDYFASWEEYFDSMAGDAIDNVKSFDENVWKFKKSMDAFKKQLFI